MLVKLTTDFDLFSMIKDYAKAFLTVLFKNNPLMFWLSFPNFNLNLEILHQKIINFFSQLFRTKNMRDGFLQTTYRFGEFGNFMLTNLAL